MGLYTKNYLIKWRRLIIFHFVIFISVMNQVDTVWCCYTHSISIFRVYRKLLCLETRWNGSKRVFYLSTSKKTFHQNYSIFVYLIWNMCRVLQHKTGQWKVKCSKGWKKWKLYAFVRYFSFSQDCLDPWNLVTQMYMGA